MRSIRASTWVVGLALAAGGCRLGFEVEQDNPDAAPGTVSLTSQADFDTPGSTRINLDTASAPGEISFAVAPAATMIAGPALTGTTNLGAHGVARPDGTFLIVHGGWPTASSTTSIYDPVTNTIAAGPGTGATPMGNTAISLRRPDGTFLILHAHYTGVTSIYDPVANTLTAGPALGANADGGTHAILRPNGTFLIVPGYGGGPTRIYDPVANSFGAGPPPTAAPERGGFAIPNADGTFLVVHGGNRSSTSFYNPAGAIGTMVAGPALTVLVDNGGHAFQRPDGTYVIVAGSSVTGTTLYDPATRTASAGPVFPAADVNGGAASLQRCDGKVVVFAGAGSTATYVYDPATNLMSAGPPASGLVSGGSHAIQLATDGRYLLVHGSTSTGTSLYAAGCPTTGSYESASLEPTGITAWRTLAWTTGADPGVTFEVRTAATQAALAVATYHPIALDGSIPAATGNAGTWLQIRATFARPIPPSPGAQAGVWLGYSSVTYVRAFARPAVQSITASFE